MNLFAQIQSQAIVIDPNMLFYVALGAAGLFAVLVLSGKMPAPGSQKKPQPQPQPVPPYAAAPVAYQPAAAPVYQQPQAPAVMLPPAPAAPQGHPVLSTYQDGRQAYLSDYDAKAVAALKNIKPQ